MELKQIVCQIEMFVGGITLQNILRWHSTRSRDGRRKSAQECRRLQQMHCYRRVVDVSSEVEHAGTLGWTRVGQHPAALGRRLAYGASTKQLDILVQRNGLFCCFIPSRGPAHAFLAIAPSTTKLPPVVSCHHSSCRDCCLSHLTPRTLPSLSPPAICTHDHAPRRVWLAALTTPLPVIRRPIYDDTTALIHTHTHYRPSSKQLHITTTKWLAL